MDTSQLKRIALNARRSLLDQVAGKLAVVLKPESAARREVPTVVNQLEKALAELGKERLIDRVAYIWFNRFCALRFMDAKRYNTMGVLTPSDGQVQPEILAEAKGGHIGDSLVDSKIHDKVFGLLNGTIKSHSGQAEAYRLLIVAVCNSYYRLMPYLFQRIDDYTELLMPDDLLSDYSILADMRAAMTSKACESVEVIGWLYQFYISEKKEEIFKGLKKNKKITPANIPAATQLFTPHWIVRYLVENSLGLLWMLNNPDSGIAKQMDYYIKPEEPESDFLRIDSPEELKICDPACGSGHMLTYAYDLLYAIYLDAGYDPAYVPALILTKNLYGIEIDERAAELASFALAMKAMKGDPTDSSNNRRRFFRDPIKPNICKLDAISFTDDELDSYFKFVGKDLFTAELRAALKDFERADNFGSLICPTINDVSEIQRTLKAKDLSGQLLLSETHQKVLQVLKQADYLSQKYHVVVVNPPYMGRKGMNGQLTTWLQNNYPKSKSDLFAVFIERSFDLAVTHGSIAMITMQSWMFLSSFKGLRARIFIQSTILSMAHLGARAFDSVGGEVVSTTAFVLKSQANPNYKGGYLRLVNGKSEAEKNVAIQEAIQNPSCGWFYHASAEDFGKIPGSPIAYWVNTKMLSLYDAGKLSSHFDLSNCIQPGDSEFFLRHWFEINQVALNSGWVFVSKGGSYRKWYGNAEYVINYSDNGYVLLTHPSTTLRTQEKYFQHGFVWSRITTGKASFRDWSEDCLVTDAGPIIYCDNYSFIAFLNSSLSSTLLELTNPTINYQVGNIGNLPYVNLSSSGSIARHAIGVSKKDWDFYETSSDFSTLPLFSPGYTKTTLEHSYSALRALWQGMTGEVQRLEEGNNRIFIEAYGLEDELTPEVPIEEITLTCNPAYRYGGKLTDEEREKRLQADTMAEFLSYAVGCMFGRYSLDQEGLILANQGETLADYLALIPRPTFSPDDDNVLPLIDFEGDWFKDDINERFKQFLRVTFGEEHFAENLTFIEESLGKSLKKYFVKDFYNDHVRRYKKRPIYWLFSSPKGTFNALIYMHRYRPDTASVVLNDYLREFQVKLEARKDRHEQVTISASPSQKDKTAAVKMIDKINKAIEEVAEYEREVLYPLAGKNIEIDLDDGVKHNYPLFGNALKKIVGLE